MIVFFLFELKREEDKYEIDEEENDDTYQISGGGEYMTIEFEVDINNYIENIELNYFCFFLINIFKKIRKA